MELYLDRRGPERTGEDRLGLAELYGGWTWNVSTIAARILLFFGGRAMEPYLYWSWLGERGSYLNSGASDSLPGFP